VHAAERVTGTGVGVIDEAILGEGRRLLDRACTGDQRDRGQAAVMSDELIDRARGALRDGQLTPPCFARVLRGAALVRNMARLPGLPPDPLVHDLIAHTVQHGLPAHNAAAQALRGTLAVSRGAVDEALDAVVDAMATLELVQEHSVERALAMSDTAALLDQLSLSDKASDLYGQSAAGFATVGMLGYQIMTTGDQVRTELLHGLWLERVGQSGAAALHFADAAGRAEAAMRLWREADPAPALDREFVGDFQAALALGDPLGDHEQELRDATFRIALPGQIVAGLALARLLAAQGRHDEARAYIENLRAECRRLQLSLPLRLALARGVDELAADHYLTALEDEMWSLREGRMRALRARLEYERLRRVDGPLLALTGIDPVTRLPDRSVLDAQLGALVTGCLAMVDVDGLDDVNERDSYADGDAVLRAIAVTARASVRSEDAVIRYSSDELLVLMPGCTLKDAATAMHRLVSCVDALPTDRGRGATVSVGLVAVEPGEGGESALVRADDATASAKSRGGNQVAVAASAPAPR
jgi:diguanylate cyclase (GGDEF)-like protein